MTRRFAPTGATLAEKLDFFSVHAPSGCWIWLGYVDAAHYGQVRWGGRVVSAHRASYEAHVGPIPDGYQVDHLCRRPRCIRPDHLQAVAPRTNVLRGTSPMARALRRAICLQGHPYRIAESGHRTCPVCTRQKLEKYRDQKRGHVPAALRAARVATGLSQREAAHRAGTTQGVLGKVELGQMNFTADLVDRLFAVYAAERAA